MVKLLLLRRKKLNGYKKWLNLKLKRGYKFLWLILIIIENLFLKEPK